MAAQAEESESKWNKGSRKEAGRGANQAQKQRDSDAPQCSGEQRSRQTTDITSIVPLSEPLASE